MKKIFFAFTMAEILISLTIIGIIAALTLPALMANLNEKVWNTQRKALHSRMAQALAAMPRLDGYKRTSEGYGDYNFVNSGLSTVLNITKTCASDKNTKCDFAMPQYTMNDEAFPREYDVVSFNTVNGESIGLWSYNSGCVGGSNSDFLISNRFPEQFACADFVYDLNGASKGPNKVGKDVGLISAFFPEYPVVVAPMPVAIADYQVSADEVEEFLASNSDSRLPSPAEAVLISRAAYLFIDPNLDQGVPIWTDNDVICNSRACTRAASVSGKSSKAGNDSAYLILVSKNGDAPRTFKTLGKNIESNAKCSKENPSACKSEKDCVSAGGKWINARPNAYCSF